jgi:diadenosine tetraphosphate (Ap4A) HIT family hydrolase
MSSLPACVFCRRDTLRGILYETEHFFLLADHAPVVEGHVLILPRTHFACFGAVPADLDSELLQLKAQVTGFCRETYRAPIFFEHGVYHQTVFHAHLHAIPVDSFPEDVTDLAAAKGAHVESQADIRAWYQIHGHYFYLEGQVQNGSPAQATIFPPSEPLYRQVLGLLRSQSHSSGGWQPQPLRRLSGHPKIRAVESAWERYSSNRIQLSPHIHKVQ